MYKLYQLLKEMLMGKRAWVIQEKNKYHVWEDVDGAVRYSAKEIEELNMSLNHTKGSYRVLSFTEKA
jgi:hypothetical protein